MTNALAVEEEAMGEMMSWSEYGEATYGDRVAQMYDAWYRDLLETEPAVALLAKLAGPGPALELGIGTGRLALPLALAGTEVHGIDASEGMIERLRAKPGAERISVTLGNFSQVAVEPIYPLVFVAFNTFFNLQSQEEQVRCFQNVAAHLRPAGRFVIEAFVPDPGRWSRDQRVAVNEIGPDSVVLELARHDPLRQVVESQRAMLTDQGIRLFPLRIRYAWPAELDLMAEIAGLRLGSRWGGWAREPFTPSSGSHVSVYRSPGG